MGIDTAVLCSLVFKPLRWGFKVAEFAAEVAWDLAGRAGTLVGLGRDGYANESSVSTDVSQAPPAPPVPARPRPAARAKTRPPAVAPVPDPPSVEAQPAAPAVAPVPAPPAAEPVPDLPVGETISGGPAEPIISEAGHVSSGTELVEEFADPGAEDGAGAEVRVAEPWEGYRSMKAADIIDRMASASTAELAAVELYELSGRKRKSVLAAAERALKRASPPR